MCSLAICGHIVIMYRTCPLSRVYLLTVYNINFVVYNVYNHMNPQLDEPQ